MCGEHSGLSERAVPRPGIIPACAGSTNVDTSTCTYIGDHPRMCGEHSSRKAFLFASMGSSPHVRGARVHQRPPRSRTGIIPACAGSTVWLYNNGTEDVGSSPHVRGAHSPLHAHQGRRGIIPACAGSTHHVLVSVSSSRDHPRMCGEHQTLKNPFASIMGSSPHVRGAQCARALMLYARGIIPACAGST